MTLGLYHKITTRCILESQSVCQRPEERSKKCLEPFEPQFGILEVGKIKDCQAAFHCTKVCRHGPRWTFNAKKYTIISELSSTLYYHLEFLLIRKLKKPADDDSDNFRQI